MVIMKRNNAISKPDWKPARYDERALLHQRLLWPRIDPPCAIMKVPNRSRINHQVDVDMIYPYNSPRSMMGVANP